MSRYYSAAEIHQLYGRPIGTIHAYASRYQWRRTTDGKRPVMYLADDVVATMNDTAATHSEQSQRMAHAKLRRQRAEQARAAHHITRFWAKVRKTNTCWEWTGARLNSGYGQCRWHGQRSVAHRVSYELCVGPIPAGLQIDHMCRNRACVNPAHLQPVTAAENVRLAIERRRADQAC